MRKTFKILAFFLLVSPLLFSGPTSHGEETSAEAFRSKVLKTFELKSGEKITGQISFESRVHYRILREDGTEQVIFKEDIVSQTLVAQEPTEAPAPIELSNLTPTPAPIPPVTQAPVAAPIPTPPTPIKAVETEVVQPAPVAVQKVEAEEPKSAPAQFFEVLKLKFTEFLEASPKKPKVKRFGQKNEITIDTVREVAKDLVDQFKKADPQSVLFACGILFGTFAALLLIWGIFIKLCVHLVGGHVSIWHAIVFQVELIFITIVISVLGVTATFYCLQIVPLLAFVPVLLMILFTFLAYFFLVTGELGLGIGQGVLFTALMIVIPAIAGMGMKTLLELSIIKF